MFHPLRREQIRSIAAIQIEEPAQASRRATSRSGRCRCARQTRRGRFRPVYGARPLKRTIQQMLENPLAKRILACEFGPGDTVLVILAGPLSRRPVPARVGFYNTAGGRCGRPSRPRRLPSSGSFGDHRASPRRRPAPGTPGCTGGKAMRSGYLPKPAAARGSRCSSAANAAVSGPAARLSPSPTRARSPASPMRPTCCLNLGFLLAGAGPARGRCCGCRPAVARERDRAQEPARCSSPDWR